LPQDRCSDPATGSPALLTVLNALEEPDVDLDQPLEIAIRVRGREDQTLKIALQNARELREILRRSLGTSG
jgi:hypothetical protein